MRMLLLSMYLLCTSSTYAQSQLEIAKQAYYQFEYQKAIELFAAHRSQSSTIVDAQLTCDYYLSMSYFELGQLSEALDHLSNGADIAIKKFGETSPQAASFYIAYGKYYHQVESYDTAAMFYHEAINILQKIPSLKPILYGEALTSIGMAYDYSESYDSAVWYYEKAAKSITISLGLYHPYTEWIYASIPYPASKSGRYRQEIYAATKRLEISQKIYGENHSSIPAELKAIAVAYQHAEAYENEQKFAQEYLKTAKSLLGEKNPTTADAFALLGSSFARLHSLDQAIEQSEKSLEIYASLEGKKGENVLRVAENIANIYFDAGQYQSALSAYEKHQKLLLSIVKKDDPMLVTSYFNMGECHENQGTFREALKMYNSALALQKASEGYQWQSSKTLRAIARIYEAQSDFIQASNQIDLAMVAHQKYNSKDQEELGYLYLTTGNLLRKQGKYQEALKAFNKVLVIRTLLYAEPSNELAQVYNNLALVYDALGDYEQAIKLQEKNLIARTTLLGEQHPQVTDILLNISAIYGNKGDVKQEIILLERVLRRSIANPDQTPIDLVSVYNNLTLSNAILGHITDAYKYNELAEKIVNDLYDSKGEPLASVYYNKGYLAALQGKLSEAESWYLKSLEIRQKIYSNNHPLIADTYNNLGVLYLDYHRYFQSVDYLEKALRIYEISLGIEHESHLSTQMNLALVDIGLGDYDTALGKLNLIINQTKNTLGDVHSSLGAAYLNLGLTYNLTGQFNNSQIAYEQALELYRKTNQPDILTADVLVNLANIDSKQKNDEKAIQRLDQAEVIYLQTLLPKNERLTRVYFAKSISLAELGRYDDALQMIQQSLNANTSENGQLNHPIFGVLCYTNAANYHYQQFKYDGQTDHLSQAIPFIEKAQQALRQSSQQNLSVEDNIQLSTYRSFLPLTGMKIYYALFQQTNNEDFLASAFTLSEASKSNALLSAMSELDLESVRGLDQSSIQRKNELADAISYNTQELFKIAHLPAKSQQANALKDRLFIQRTELSQLTQILQQNQTYQQLTADLPLVNVREVQESLQSSEAVISFGASDDSLTYIFAITQTGFEVFRQPIDQRLEIKIKALLNAINYKLTGSFETVAEELYQLLMADAINYVKQQDVDKLILTTESVLNNFPFEVLRNEGRYLVEDFDISYSYSQTLSRFINQQQQRKSDNSYVAFAPVFGDASNSTMSSGAREVFAASRALSKQDVRGFSINGQMLNALPGTLDEVNQIQQIINANGMTSKLLVNEEAKEDYIKSEAMNQVKYLHFATHGFVNTANAQFSGIFLSQVTDEEEDCVLFASEIYNLDLSAELVSLSACETGLGTLSMGEGLIGLSRAFTYAGAKNLLVSQWQVSDASTAQLMVDFYDEMISGQTKSAALRTAKLKLIASEEYKQPYYWAPFILIGK